MTAAFVGTEDLLSVCGIVLGSCGGLLEASSEPLGGPLGASGRLPGADFGPPDGPCSPWAAPGPVPGRLLSSPGRPGRPPGPLLAALGGSWASLGPPCGGSWAAPGALLAPPKRLLEPPRRLQSRSLPKSQNSSTVQRFSIFFAPPGAHLAPPEALLGLSWRPLGPSWRLLGGLSGVGRLLGGSWPAQVGPGWSLGGPGLVPWWARDRAQFRGSREPVRIHCID